jgi:hypothetical protein
MPTKMRDEDRAINVYVEEELYLRAARFKVGRYSWRRLVEAALERLLRDEAEAGN